MELGQKLVENKVLISAVIGWVVAQIIKTIIDCIINKKFDANRLVGAGGMPSSHSSTVTAMAAAAFIIYGASSSEFAITFILAMIVMYDAMGVRRETGKQSVLLKLLIKDYPKSHPAGDFAELLKEYVGHTPLQVAAGIILGFIVALMVCFT